MAGSNVKPIYHYSAKGLINNACLNLSYYLKILVAPKNTKVYANLLSELQALDDCKSIVLL